MQDPSAGGSRWWSEGLSSSASRKRRGWVGGLRRPGGGIQTVLISDCAVKGRSGPAGRTGQALPARSRAMSMQSRAGDYLAMRRSLGFKLHGDGRMLAVADALRDLRAGRGDSRDKHRGAGPRGAPGSGEGEGCGGAAPGRPGAGGRRAGDDLLGCRHCPAAAADARGPARRSPRETCARTLGWPGFVRAGPRATRPTHDRRRGVGHRLGPARVAARRA